MAEVRTEGSQFLRSCISGTIPPSWATFCALSLTWEVGSVEQVGGCRWGPFYNRQKLGVFSKNCIIVLPQKRLPLNRQKDPWAFFHPRTLGLSTIQRYK